MTYQFYNPAPVHFDLNGLQPAANGSLVFYDIGATTPRTTWSDPGQTTPNANPITLGPDARSPVPIFLDGDYTIVCRDSLGAVVWTRDVVSPEEAANTIPALSDGQFLTNDGSNLLWADLIQIPDPTGSTSHYLTTDGANLIWTSIPTPPTIPDLEIEVTSSTFQAGVSTDNTKFRILKGTGNAPSSGTKYTNTTISFTAGFFDNVWSVAITPTTASTTASGAIPTYGVTSLGTGGATVNFNIPDDDTNSSWQFSSDVPFIWIAFGTKEIAP